MKRSNDRVRAQARRLVRAGVPLDPKEILEYPAALQIKIVEPSYYPTEVFTTRRGETGLMAHLSISASRDVFIEDFAVEFPWGGGIDRWAEATVDSRTGARECHNDNGQSFSAASVLNARLAGKLVRGGVLEGLLLGFSSSRIPRNWAGQTARVCIKVWCAPDTCVVQEFDVPINRRLPAIPSRPTVRREPLLLDQLEETTSQNEGTKPALPSRQPGED
ncbi:MAG: hypothetical protein JOY79_01240 [Acidobacteriaceae bacterium]|nr:hypothetical protein [Acidobacteriaceae bacterium]